jgi:hypothetical protein
MPNLRRKRAVRVGDMQPEYRDRLFATPATSRATLTASAASLDLDTNKVFKMRTYDQEWQNEAWRHFDICGEYRFATERQAAALSRATFYVADVDEMGNIGEETKDPDVKPLSSTLFGDEANRAHNVQAMGTNLYVAGECYIAAEGASNPDSDRWYICSRKEMRKEGGTIQVRQPLEFGGGWHTMVGGTDLLIRVWNPHPRTKEIANSPTRAALPVLREIERLTMLSFSQIDSRLISAGLLLVPEGIDFPHNENETGGIQGILDRIKQAADASLQGAGTAAGLVPIMAEVPIEAQGRGSVQQSFAHIKFDTPLTAELKEKLDQTLRRLALNLDVAPEDLLGQGDANHWSAWSIEEQSIKIFIEPALIRACAAFNIGYLQPALKRMGKDPTKFSYWYDPSALVVRPNRQADAVTLFEQDALSLAALRKAGAWDETDAPSAKELQERRLWELAKVQPQLIADPQVAKILGLPIGIQVTAPPPQQPDMGPVDANGMPLPPDQAAALPDSGQDQRALPSADQAQGDQGGTQPAITASAAMLPAMENTVLRALELAGGRLLDRNTRGRFATIPRYELHTQVHARDYEHAQELMVGAWAHVPRLAAHYNQDAGKLQELLSRFCAELLTRGYAYSSDLLEATLTTATSRRML